mmetsp:Transcript_4391/g.7148  ORF Transcript_4391/g.7148 Transcript_4391/m.7148 type:complete len:245 (+) Transcript_4391:3273-4007(+)
MLGRRRVRRAALHPQEVLRHPPLQRVQVLAARHDQLHERRRVVPVVEGEQRLAQARLAQRLQVARAELVVRVGRVGRGLLQLVQPPLVGLQVVGVLAVHRAQLAVGSALREQRRLEEVREALQGPAQRARVHLKVHVRVLGGRERVGEPAVGREVLLIRPLLRIGLRAQKKHVFMEMRQSWKLFWVLEMAGMDVDSCSCCVCVRVRGQQTVEPVLQPDVTKFALISVWFLDRIIIHPTNYSIFQ